MRILLALAAVLAFPLVATADVQSDMQQVAAAYNAQKSVHADEQFSNGQRISVDFVPPDRVRVTQPATNTSQVIIGDNYWVYSSGKWSKIPSFVAKTVTGKIDQYRHLMPQDITDVKDLGMQNVNGKPLHAYQFTSSGVPATMWVDANHLPAQMQTTSRGITTTVIYSYGNVTIDPPQ